MTRDYVILRATAHATHEPFNIPIIKSTGHGPFARGVSIKVDGAKLSPADIHTLAADPTVAAIAPRMPTKLIEPKASAAGVASTWGLDAVNATTSSQDGSGVVVAVLDTGIDRTHPAFTGVTLIEQDFSGDGHGDVVGHGTHCAGTIFGRKVGGTRIGIAPGVTRALIGKVLDDRGAGDTQGLVDGVLWAARNDADIISMSLGFDFPSMVSALEADGIPHLAAVSQTLVAYRANLRLFDSLMALLAASAPFGREGLVIAAAGNESDRPHFVVDASLPAAATGVIAVGAAERRGASHGIAVFSNGMPQVCGPGVDVLSARTGGGLVGMSGTSMATPHVAGVAALHWQALGASASVARVAAALRHTARAAAFVPGLDPSDIGDGLVTAPA